MRRKALAAVAVACALTLSLVGCSSDSGDGGASTASGEIDRDATLRVGIDSVPMTFDPIQNPGNQGNYTLPELYDQLVQLDENFQPEAMLATKWEYNADGTELTMTLRDDAVFNTDGAPVNADAVKASMERAKTDKASLVAPLLANLTSVTAVDDTTVKFSFAGPAFSFVSDLANDPRLSSVVDPAHMDNLATDPAGSGPYTLGDATQSKVVFNRVADHWDETSGLAKTIELSGIPDQNSRFNAVKAGQLDVTYINTGQFDDAKQLTDSGKFQSFYEPQVQTFGLRVNGTPGSPMSDPAVREAISVGIDRTQFCSTAFPDMSTPTRQLVAPVDPAFDKSLDDEASLAAQTDKTTSLLADAGESDLDLTFLSFATMVTIAEVPQQQLADAGVTVKIEQQATYPAVIGAWLTGKYDVSTFAFAVGDASSIVRQNIETDPISGGVPDYAKAAYDKANTTPPGAERDAAFKELNKVLTEQPVNIPLCNVGLGLIGSSQVTGLENVRYLGYAPPFETRRLGLTK
ncbi:ABC transporter substrate-binding protein [Nocardioides sp.]|uniref:ABC transporter substrate-binding protein n=1 Tax=Nocardioides sp. TaxID=35761 RepID=UPI003D0D2A98